MFRHLTGMFAVLVLALGMTTGASAAATIKLAPSGDAATDQAALQAALAAAGSDPATTVKLMGGVFYLNEGVRATGFRGTLQGEGRDETMIRAIGSGIPANRGSVLLFIDGEPTIKGLSIEAPDGSTYQDSNPGLFVSDGGAAIDIFGGSATIKDVGIKANGPNLIFSPDDSLETGILLHNCDGDFTLKDSSFEGVKRSFVFNPEAPSTCDLVIKDNEFQDNRGGIFLIGGNFGVKGGNVGEATLKGNLFDNTLVNDILGLLIEYPVSVTENEIHHPDPSSGNSAIEFGFGTGPLTISENQTNGLYVLGNIVLSEQTGGTLIAENVVNGSSSAGFGAIAVDTSDDVLIRQNDLSDNPYIPGWSVPALDSFGAYSLFSSTNVGILEEILPPGAAGTCQVLHVPEKDASNVIDLDLGECEFTP